VVGDFLSLDLEGDESLLRIVVDCFDIRVDLVALAFAVPVFWARARDWLSETD
jgi:hypothetical protein